MTASPTGGTLTRVTLAAPQRRVDLVLPSGTPLGELLPDVVRLLGFRPGEPPRSYRFSLFDGRVLGFEQSLRSAGVPDGALVRVDRISEAPMPAVVHDVTDEVADDLERRPGRWGDAARRWLATAVVAAAALWATLLAVPVVPAPALLAVGAAVLLGGAALTFVAREVGTAVTSAGAAIAATAIPHWLTGWPLRTVAWAVLVGVAVFAGCAGNGRLRAGATGAGALLGLLALWVGFSSLRLPGEQVAALLAVLSTVALGLLPRFALVTAGLTRLDDQQLGDRPTTRTSVRAAVDAAHRGLALAVVFTAASAAAAGWVLADAPNAWAAALAGLLAVTTWLRTRACPLTVEVASLTAAALTVVVALVTHWLPTPTGALVAVAVLGLGVVALTYRPPAHVRARARQLGDRVEGLAVVAMVPVAVGVFGTYEHLLHVF